MGLGGSDHKGISHVAEVELGGDWERDETIQQFKFPKLAKVSQMKSHNITFLLINPQTIY